jgi:subtilisin family serine protease
VATGDKVRIAVIDSGIAGDAPQRMRFPIVSEHNVLDPTRPNQATDDHGHGTAVTLLIDDLAENAEFIVIKVAGHDGRIAEWDALAALVARTDSHVLNLSMQFGLPYRAACKVCGRTADLPASRSAVFENLVEQVWNRPEEPVLLAAAGNSSLPELAYPSRFGNVLAIGAVTSARELSTESNYGDVDATGSPHLYHFVMPGGEGDPAKAEEVLSSANGSSWFGTSFATAFGCAAYAKSRETVHTSSPQAMAITSTPVHLSQAGRDTEDQAIQPGSTIQAISPSQKAMPTGRNVTKMNRPSCHRSSFSRVACDLSLW